eukprot:GHVP01014031.1.p1 GENE.GHVP01014031.1~~GHVP01014031.1.p1  ORF type:complete len:192 (-),score=49.87 GHVP01014031.1:70-594(-)
MDKKSEQEITDARERMRQKFGAIHRMGGSGQRIVKRLPHKGSSGDEKKLGAILKRLGLGQLSGIEEVSFMMKDGTQMVFANPKVQAAPSSKTYYVGGQYEEKPLDAAAMLGPMFQDGHVPPEVLSRLAAQFGQKEKRVDRDATPDIPEIGEVNFEEFAIDDQAAAETADSPMEA